MSAEKKSEEVGYGLLRLMLSGASCLAAVGVVFACFSSPGHLQPILSVAISCVAAILGGTLCIRAFHNPAPAVFLPSLAILTGAMVGIVSIGKESQGSWIVLLGNIQVLGAWEVFFRFFIALVNIGVLGVFCTSHRLARGLSVFAVSGPGLLLLYLARAGVVAYWPGAETWKIQGALIGVFLALLIVWTILLRKSLILEKIRDAIGLRAVAKALSLENPTTINMALGLIDGWIDPLHRVGRRVQDLAEAEESYARQEALSKNLKTLKGRSYVLPLWCRQKLETTASDKPEALIVLAEDDFLRKRPVDGFVYLAQMMNDIAPSVSWLVDAALATWDRHRPSVDMEVQQALWKRVKTQQSDSKPALTALAMIALEQGLSTKILNSIGR